MPEPETPLDATLHLYAQGAWHDAAYIVGTRTALTRLRDTLALVLDDDLWTEASQHASSFFTSDGEGYTVRVTVESEAGMLDYVMPYTWDVANGGETPDGNPLWPKKKARG